MVIKKCLLICCCLVLVIPNLIGQKIDGMSFRGPYDGKLNLEMFENVKQSNADWIALIPEARLNRQNLAIEVDCEEDEIKEITESIQFAKAAGLKVFIKPHLVLTKPVKGLSDKTAGAEWRGAFVAKNEADWVLFEHYYESYILALARIASELEVDLFSIGTELKGFALDRPVFWQELIVEVRKIYQGPVIYCANWDEYQQIIFWDQLDYIGVDSYFPISTMKTPSVKRTMANWRSIRQQLKKVSQKSQRKILLTEFGYQNVSYAGDRPWTHDYGNVLPNNEAQTNLYRAFFQTFWDEPWVAGGFAWEWFYVAPSNNTTFSVQNKPALAIVQKWYQ